MNAPVDGVLRLEVGGWRLIIGILRPHTSNLKPPTAGTARIQTFEPLNPEPLNLY